MKTTLKPGKPILSPYHLHDSVGMGENNGLKDLENGAEIFALIQEAQNQLSPCAHCGYERPAIRYCYRPGDKYPDKVLPDGTISFHECPHEIYAECGRRSVYLPLEEQGCHIRTKDWHAEDDEADFKEALRLTIDTWNRRPSDPK